MAVVCIWALADETEGFSRLKKIKKLTESRHWRKKVSCGTLVSNGVAKQMEEDGSHKFSPTS